MNWVAPDTQFILLKEKRSESIKFCVVEGSQMLTYTILMILIIQVLSALLSSYYGTYNAILAVTQSTEQKIISLLCFGLTSTLLYLNRKKIVLQDINFMLISYSLVGIYLSAFLIRLILQKLGIPRDYDYNFEFISLTGFFLQTIINFTVATLFILLSFSSILKISSNDRLTLVVCFLINLTLPTLTCVQLLYLEFINIKYF
jgi:hypothetical protein